MKLIDKRDEYVDEIIALLDEPRTIKWLAGHLGVSERSIYRYLRAIDEMQIDLIKEGLRRPVQYRLDT